MAKARERFKSRRWALFAALGLVVLMLALAAAWRWTPLGDVVDFSVIAGWLDDANNTVWMPFIVAAVYVGASLLMFPNTVLCLAIVLSMDPLEGIAYAFGGSLLAALVGYSMGRWGGKRIAKWRVGPVDRISAELRRGGGFMQVLALRLLPVAPFSATNILSGAARVRLLPFVAATTIGIAPYILTFGIFGRQTRRLVSNPTLADAALTLGIAAAAGVAAWRMRAMAAARVK